jgi:uncharacterized phage protein gp47/JayE
MNTRARNLFGEDVNLSERSPLGLFFRVTAWSTGILWQLAEKVYHSGYMDEAEGIQKDKVAKNLGIQRLSAQRATGNVVIKGDPGTIIPLGFMVETQEEIQFETTEEKVIGSIGEVTIPIQAVIAGIEGNVQGSTITKLVNPTIGVESVNNSLSTTGGRNTETDAEFVDRYYQSLAKGGASTPDSIRANLLQLPGVRAAAVIENNTMETDPVGRPPKSISCYVLGGEREAIAKAILDTKAGGIEPFGTEEVVVKDLAGQPKLIRFTFANEVFVYCRVQITKSPSYPLDGDKQVRTAILKYIGGTDEDNNVYTGLNMGQGVIYNKIVNAILSIPGIEDFNLEIAPNNSGYMKANIPISSSQVAETRWDKVVVTSA